MVGKHITSGDARALPQLEQHSDTFIIPTASTRMDVVFDKWKEYTVTASSITTIFNTGVGILRIILKSIHMANSRESRCRKVSSWQYVVYYKSVVGVWYQEGGEKRNTRRHAVFIHDVLRGLKGSSSVPNTLSQNLLVTPKPFS